MQIKELHLRIFGILCLGAAVGLVLLSRAGAVGEYAWVVVAGSLVALVLALVAFVLRPAVATAEETFITNSQ